jgi:hypothetical protein
MIPRRNGWVKVRMAGGAKLYSCYEARPLGYGLHRELTALVAGRSCAAPPGKAMQFSLDPVPAADILRASRFRIWNLRPH